MDKKPQNWSQILLIFVGFTAILSISGGVYFLAFQKPESVSDSLYLNAAKDNQQPNIKLSPTLQVSFQPTTSPVALQDVEEKDKWKEYRTKIYQIKYPKDWKIKYYPDLPTAVQFYLPDPDNKSSSSSGTLAPSQYVTVLSTTSKQTAIQYVDRIQVTCCIGPSGTATAAATFQKVPVVIGGRAGIAYKTPTNPAGTWNVVMANGSEVINMDSSITDLYAITLANQVINTFIFLK